MNKLKRLQQTLDAKFADVMTSHSLAHGEVTIEVQAEHLFNVCKLLHDDADLNFAC